MTPTISNLWTIEPSDYRAAPTSDLIDSFKIVNRKYDINPDLFFQLEEGDRRGHE